MDDRTAARGLARSRIGLAETLARATRPQGHEGLIRLYGLREIASGLS